MGKRDGLSRGLRLVKEGCEAYLVTVCWRRGLVNESSAENEILKSLSSHLRMTSSWGHSSCHRAAQAALLLEDRLYPTHGPLTWPHKNSEREKGHRWGTIVHEEEPFPLPTPRGW